MMPRRNRSFSADEINILLADLGRTLEATGGSHTDLFIVGGAAMALAYDASRATQDLDAVYTKSDIFESAVRDIAAEKGLPEDWLNDAAKGFMPGNDTNAQVFMDTPSLTVYVASAEYLLAMKLYSARGERDAQDAILLFNQLGLTSVGQSIEILERYYPARLLLPKHRFMAEEVADRALEIRQGHFQSRDDVAKRLSQRTSRMIHNDASQSQKYHRNR